jgi:hypothetical protein
MIIIGIWLVVWVLDVCKPDYFTRLRPNGDIPEKSA